MLVLAKQSWIRDTKREHPWPEMVIITWLTVKNRCFSEFSTKGTKCFLFSGVSVYWLSIWSRLMWEKKVFLWVEGTPFHLSYRIDAPIFRTYPCVNLIKDVSRRWRTNIRELTIPCAHVSQRIPLSRKTPFSCARRWDGKREWWGNFFSTLRKCEKRCRIKELAWFDIRRQSQRVEMYQQKIRRN